VDGRIRPVVLAGPPCVGKTSCGREAASLLRIPFSDLDDLIGAAAGIPPGVFLAESGEQAFRLLEKRCLFEALGPSGPFLLAVGGGALLEKESLDLVLRSAVLITLRASDRVLLSRPGEGMRPLARDGIALLGLLEARRAHYDSLPGQLDCGMLDIAGCAARIAAAAIEAGFGS
jgi:shikimate kinase